VKRNIDVWQRAHEIEVRQSAKHEWLAAGHYMGQRIVVQARSELGAVNKWREAAKSLA
jgi:hypothetical protein